MTTSTQETTTVLQTHKEGSKAIGVELRQGVVSLVGLAVKPVPSSIGSERVAEDVRIATAIQRVLENDARVSLQSIQSTVSHGHVLLEGRVPSPLLQTRIEQVLENIPGIQSITNWIRVAGLIIVCCSIF